MANKPYKFKIPAGTVNTVQELHKQLDLSRGNGFRIDKLQFQIPDLDAIATSDLAALQITNVSRSGESALLNIDDPTEILTLGKEFQSLGTNGPEVANELRKTGLIWHDLEIIIVDENFYLTALITGQDAAIDAFLKIWGNYIDIDPAVAQEIQGGAAL
jgi:hypothetical protein